MVTRSDVLEKFFGRRFVSCLGWSLLLFFALIAGLLAYSYFGTDKSGPEPRNTTPPPAHG